MAAPKMSKATLDKAQAHFAKKRKPKVVQTHGQFVASLARPKKKNGVPQLKKGALTGFNPNQPRDQDGKWR